MRSSCSTGPRFRASATPRATKSLPKKWLARRKTPRSEEHTSELQSPCNLVCRLLLEKKNTQQDVPHTATHRPLHEQRTVQWHLHDALLAHCAAEQIVHPARVPGVHLSALHDRFLTVH